MSKLWYILDLFIDTVKAVSDYCRPSVGLYAVYLRHILFHIIQQNIGQKIQIAFETSFSMLWALI